MTLYKTRETVGLLKWVLAIVIFVLAMTITFSDVEGFDLTVKQPLSVEDASQPADNPTDQNPYSPFLSSSGSGDASGYTDDLAIVDDIAPRTPTATPEPSSLILISTGLGSLLLFRRRKHL